MLKLVFVLGLLGLTFAASGSSSKREDTKASDSNHQPVYSPSASSQASSGSGLDSSSKSYQPASANQRGQYYYYYPVQEKPKVQDSSISASELQPTFAASSFNPVRSNFDTTSVQSSSGSDVYQGAADTQDLTSSPYANQYGALNSGQFGSFNGGQFGGTSAGQFGTDGVNNGFDSGVNQLIAGGYGGGFQGNAGGYLPSASSLNYQYGNGAGGYGVEQTSNGFGLYSLAMPILGLIGLGLLLPTVTSLTGTSASTRRKREVGEICGR
ncbi:glycine, alanine and asparagine-rich protein-like [Limulus polyphemus]|uniref:Glycine, alanine and asparagine-rich protein-like n=1 Tax=Limulus polyphemus TaxID=6850 RepID=A0ABM1RY66_LIMPO|nr:glycine, alanine and asparagine-rich protein-like [Limulus polyphemus]